MVPHVTPEALVEKYHSIQVIPPVGHPGFLVSIHRYRCANSNNGGAAAGIAFMDEVPSAARHLHPPADTTHIGLGYTVRGCASPSQFRFTLDLLARILVETPRRFANLHLPPITNLPHGITDASFLAHLNDPSQGLEPKLQMIADCLMGLDCDGFIGNYLYLCGLEPNQYLACTRRPDAFVRNPRDFASGLSAIRRFMVIQWPNNAHIAIVSRPVLAPGSWLVCESTGDMLAGVRSANYTIVEGRAPGTFTVHRPENSCANCHIGPVGLEWPQVP